MSVSNWSSSSNDQDDDTAWSRARLAEEGVAYRVVNVLGSGFVNDRVDIKKLALLVRNADYAPRGFSALVMRFQAPRATVLLYRSGKFVVIGATSVADAKLAAEKLISILKYEPELFPGLIYRMLRPKCTLLIFISGKIVITGCEVRLQIICLNDVHSCTSRG
ncbi:TATA-box-binding protein [Phytophthora nicotianae]|uniref:TATA-box-binding protein n=1 Tax=Phytophthora nicotianae TaxID=4792 RepID=A0A0W8BXN3_PHYNI|nr:TATA-box-binding protein [Phytophthora nicotianae]